MSNSKRFEFIAENLAGAMQKQSSDFRKRNEILMHDIFSQGDYKKYTEIMANAVKESIDTMEKWEKTIFEELDGLTPEQYFSGIASADDVVELVSELIDKNEGMIPPSLTESIKNQEDLESEIAAKIDSIVPDANGLLTLIQKAAIKCAEMVPSEKILDSVSKLLFRFDSRTAGDSELQYIMDVFKEIGKESIPCLIAACEKSGHKGDIYISCIMTLAEIASKYKSEEIYMYLKERFRKSDFKLVEADALALYGDGRAIAAIRGYVERNISSINEADYSSYRDIVLRLDGMVDDLDREYMAINRNRKL